MLFAFIDESYTAERYYVAAVVIDGKEMSRIGDALQQSREYASGFGVTEPNVEFHAHSLMTGTDGWEPVAGKARAAIGIYRHALRGLAALPMVLIVRGVDVVRLNARYRYPEAPHQVALRHALERVDSYAWSKQDRVTVIADEIADQATHVVQTAGYQHTGTGGYNSIRLQQIDMPIFFGPSDQSPGVQAADMTAYLYRRLDAHTETHERTAAAVRSLWGETAPIRRHVKRWDP